MIYTPPPAPEPIRFEQLLALSWALFRRNWIIALPPIIAMAIILIGVVWLFAVIFAAAYANGGLERGGSPSIGAAFIVGYLGFFGATIVVSFWSLAAMYGMADAAWARGTATFADGFTAFRTRAGALIVAGIGMFGLAIAAFILLLPTLGLSLLALPLFTMYVVPSVVTGGRDGFTAIAESFRLVLRFFGSSAITLLILIAIQYGIGIVGSLPLYPLQFAMMASMGNQSTPHLPAIGAGFLAFAVLWFVVIMIAGQAYTAYYTVALVGLYRSLFAQPGASAPPSAGAIVTA